MDLSSRLGCLPRVTQRWEQTGGISDMDSLHARHEVLNPDEEPPPPGEEPLVACTNWS